MWASVETRRLTPTGSLLTVRRSNRTSCQARPPGPPPFQSSSASRAGIVARRGSPKGRALSRHGERARRDRSRRKSDQRSRVLRAGTHFLRSHSDCPPGLTGPSTSRRRSGTVYLRFVKRYSRGVQRREVPGCGYQSRQVGRPPGLGFPLGFRSWAVVLGSNPNRFGTGA